MVVIAALRREVGGYVGARVLLSYELGLIAGV